PRENYLFFAKIPSRSSDCSHLVEQVRRTVELLFSVDDSFRKGLMKTMKKHYPRAARGWLDRRPVPGQWKFCLVSLGKDKAELPFFAKCGVRRLARNLDQLGHPLYFAAV
ncbi:MAG: hypothetical protein DIU71_01890, partial [Proteobacteria bacterium]